MDPCERRPVLRDPALWALLVTSFALSLQGISWGLPSIQGWAMDELLPARVLEGMSVRFSFGWFDKYPPFHYYLLAALYAPVLRANDLSAGPPVPADVHYVLFLLGRGLSAVMAAGTLVFVFLCGRELLDRRAALLASALVASMAPFVFYAKLANLDVPYVFWWTLSLLFFVRCLRRRHGADLVLFALTAVLATVTKDQAFALYVLPVFLVLAARWRQGGLRALWGADVLAAAGGAAVLFVALQNLVWNGEGFRSHLALITGPASQDFREWSGDLGGQLGLLVQSVRHVRFALGTPAFVLCLAGLVVYRRERLLWALLVPGLSYYLFFIALVLYSYDRFMLPLGVLLAFFGGRLLAEATARHRLIGWGVVALLLAYGGARAFAVGHLMVHDARYAAEAWLRENAKDGLVGAVGPLEHLPRLDGLRFRAVGHRPESLARIRPDLLVVNADYGRRAPEGTGEHEFYARLEREELGYVLASEHHFATALVALELSGLGEADHPRVLSNLGKVNPRIRIYRRKD